MPLTWFGSRRSDSVLAASARRRRGFQPGLADGLGTLETRALLAAELPAGFVDYQVVDGLSNPTALEVAPDGRVFVSEQQGTVRVIQDGKLLPQPLLSVPVAYVGEQGLQSLVVDPNFAQNGYVYIYYSTLTQSSRNRIERWTVEGNTARPDSATVLLELDPLQHGLHNGGAMHFGPDGMLYVAVGDGYVTSDQAQSLDSFFGKMLRIRPDGSIPSDNPFVGQTTGPYQAIWALGLRNPYTFAIDAHSGQMLINDVGLASWDEVNRGRAGANYGWPISEGPTADPRFDTPVFAYPHQSDGGPIWGCAVTGGTFYHTHSTAPTVFPAEYQGLYFFHDFCNSALWTMNPATGQVSTFGTGLAEGAMPALMIDLDMASDSGLYYLVRGGQGYAVDGDTTGSLRKVAYNPTVREPQLVHPPRDQRVGLTQPATFSAGAIGEGTLLYQWQRNGRDIPGATAATYTVPRVQQRDSGAKYRVVIGNAFGTITSPAATLTVVNTRPPRVNLIVPGRRASAIARPGEEIQARASAVDGRGRRLPDDAFSWRVDLHHDQHTHPFLPSTRGGRSLKFTIPGDLHEQGRLWYRIRLTVTDADGLSTSTDRDIRLT